MLQILFSCIPLLIFFIVVKVLKLKVDNFVNLALLAYLTAVIVMYVFNSILGLFIPDTFRTIGGVAAYIYYLCYAGFSEETSKFITLKISKPKTKSQILINIILIGLLFGVIENYAYFGMDISYKSIFVRLFNMHILFGCIMGMLLVLGEEKNKKTLFNVLALVIPILIHGTWDFANGSMILFIIAGIVCYASMVFVLTKAKKYQEEEALSKPASEPVPEVVSEPVSEPVSEVVPEAVVEKPKKKSVVKIAALVIITLAWLLAYSNSDSRTELGKTCEYNDYEITILDAEKMDNEDGQYIRIKVEVKNNSSGAIQLDSGLGGFRLVRLDNGEKAMETLTLFNEEKPLSYDVPANGTNTGYLFFKVPGELNEYKLTYNEYQNSNTCNMNIE